MGHLTLLPKKSRKKSVFQDVGDLATELKVSQTTGFVPFGLQLEVAMNSDRRAKADVILRQLGTQRTYKHLIPGRDHGNSANQSIGWQGAFAVRDVGETTFEADVICWEDGVFKHQVLTKTVTGVDPNAYFTAAETIAIDEAATPNWTGARSGAVQVTSYQAAVDLVKSEKRRKWWFQFKRGQKVSTLSDDESGRRGIIYAHFMNADTTLRYDGFWSAYGAGTELPELTATDRAGVGFSHFRNIDTSFVIYGLRIKGEWDPETGIGTSDGGIWDNNQNATTSAIDCEFINCRVGAITRIELDSNLSMEEQPWDQNRRFSMINSKILGWSDYGLFTEMGSCMFSGCFVQQPQNMKTGDDFKQDKEAARNFADHGPSRGAFPWRIAYVMCDMACWNGWSSNAYGHQSASRNNANQTLHARILISQCTLEGGFGGVVTNDAMNGGTHRNPCDPFMVQHCSIIGTENTSGFFSTSSTGVVIRNNICVMPNVPKLGDLDSFSTLFNLGRSGEEGQVGTDGVVKGEQRNGNLNGYVRIYGNTFIDLRSDLFTQKIEMQTEQDIINAVTAEGFTDIQVFNNAFHAPNRANPRVSSIELDRTPTAPPSYKGPYWASVINPTFEVKDFTGGFSPNFDVTGQTSGATASCHGSGRITSSTGFVTLKGVTGTFVAGEYVAITNESDGEPRGGFTIVQQVDRRLTEFGASDDSTGIYTPGYASRAKIGADMTRERTYYDYLGRVRAEAFWRGAVEVEHEAA